IANPSAALGPATPAAPQRLQVSTARRLGGRQFPAPPARQGDLQSGLATRQAPHDSTRRGQRGSFGRLRRSRAQLTPLDPQGAAAAPPRLIVASSGGALQTAAARPPRSQNRRQRGVRASSRATAATPSPKGRR